MCGRQFHQSYDWRDQPWRRQCYRFNSAGVGVTGAASTKNAIEGNSIFGNTGLNTIAGLGIDLFGDGLTPNDAGDADTGPNDLQNFPVLTSANFNAGTAAVSGTLNSAVSTQYRIEFFSNTSCDPTGYGEGQTFLSAMSVTTNGSGNATINTNLAGVQLGQYITATATDPTGNT